MIDHAWKRNPQPLPDHPSNQHCGHAAGPPWMLQPPGPGRPHGMIGAPETCCWCGPLRVKFFGIIQEGHGPFVSYEQGSKIIVA